MASISQNPMQGLYQRLRSLGFDTPYVRNEAMSDWWDDEAASTPAGYQEGLMLLSRHLGISLRSLQDETQPLELRDFGPCNFKRSPGKTADDLAIPRAICTRAAQIAAASFESSWQGGVPASGARIRENILSKGKPWVGLGALVDWCWSIGIPVLHISDFPNKTKKMDGMAALVDGRPVIVLCKNQKQNAWLLFILAHELGHVIHGHIEQNGVLVDGEVSSSSEDPQEAEADATAVEILTGDSNCRFHSGGQWLKANELASRAKSYGKENQIAPGHVVLNYCNSKGKNFYGLANNALNIIAPNADAPQLIYEKMVAHLDWGGLPEDSSEFLKRIAKPKQRK